MVASGDRHREPRRAGEPPSRRLALRQVAEEAYDARHPPVVADEADVDRLAGQWTEISEAAAKRTESGSGTPVALYEEPDLLVKVVRDLFNEDFSKLVVQGEKSWNTVNDYVSELAPEMADRLERHLGHVGVDVDRFCAILATTNPDLAARFRTHRATPAP